MEKQPANKSKQARARRGLNKTLAERKKRDQPKAKPMLPWRNPVVRDSGMIDVEVQHPRFGWVPFTISADDASAAVNVRRMDAEARAEVERQLAEEARVHENAKARKPDNG